LTKHTRTQLLIAAGGSLLGGLALQLVGKLGVVLAALGDAVSVRLPIWSILIVFLAAVAVHTLGAQPKAPPVPVPQPRPALGLPEGSSLDAKILRELVAADGRPLTPDYLGVTLQVPTLKQQQAIDRLRSAGLVLIEEGRVGEIQLRFTQAGRDRVLDEWY